MKFSYLKIVVFTPLSHAGKVREALAEAGAGSIGNYDSCSFSMRGIGRFRPGAGADPFIGEAGKMEEVEEERVEVICEAAKLDFILAAVRKIHPYEEPAIDIYPLLNQA